MAGKNWQAGGKNSIPALALVCLVAIAGPCGSAWAAPPSGGFAPASYVGDLDPNVIWELLIGGIVVVSFLAAVGLWALSALRGVKRSQLAAQCLRQLRPEQSQSGRDDDRRAAAASSSATTAILEIYGLSRADISRDMTGRDLLELRRSAGPDVLSTEEFERACPPARKASSPNFRTGRSVLSKIFRLPNGGSIGTHEDCTEQRKLSRKLASTTQFLELVLDNVPVCVAAKNIEDGRYIFVNRAFERFSRFSRDHIVGKRADEIFRPETAASIEAADEAALKAPEGHHRSEFSSNGATRSALSPPTAWSRATRTTSPNS